MAYVTTAPTTDALLVTTSDTLDLTKGTTRYLMVSVAGNVKVTMASGTQITFTGLTVGVAYPFAVTRIWATGTTATGIIALY